MTNEEKAIFDNIMTEIKANQLTAEKVQEMIKTSGLVDAKAIEDLRAEIKAITDAQGLKITEMEQKGEKAVPVTIREQIKAGLTENAEGLKKLKTEKTQFSFEVKAVGTMTTAASVTGYIPQAQRIAGLNEIPLRTPLLINLLPNSSTASNRIEWAYEVAGEGGAGGTVEGNKKSQIDADFKVGAENVIKRTVFVKISEEMLGDIDWMTSYIENRLLGMRLMLDLEDQVLNGTTSTSSLHGIIEQSTAWDAGTFALTIVEANELDAVMVAANQVMIAHHVPNLIIMHPSDITKLALTKDKDGQYLFPSFQLPSGKEIGGIPVLSSTVMTAREFVVCDRTKATIYNREGIRIEAGYDGNDFTYNLRTIRAEARLALVIETNDKTAFVYGNFDTAIAALKRVEA